MLIKLTEYAATEVKVDMTLMICLLGLEFLVASWPFSVLRSLSGS